MRLLALAVLCIAASACGVLYSPESVSEESIRVAAGSVEGYGSSEPSAPASGGHGDEDWPWEFDGAATAPIEQRVYLADVIVRANLVSAANDLLSFTALEYLKGTGPTTFTVSADTANRDAQWDGNEAILFLTRAASSQARSVSATFEFTDTTTAWSETGDLEYRGPLDDGYTINRANPVWLPSTSSGSDQTRGASDTSSYVEEAVSVSGEASPSIALTELKALIEWIEGGDGIDGYDRCLRGVIGWIRYTRDVEAFERWLGFEGEVWPHWNHVFAMESGVAANTNISTTQRSWQETPVYHEIWVEGEDAELFAGINIDEDDDPSNGYRQAYVNARPLPAGTYKIIDQWRSYITIICDYTFPPNSDMTINVTAPAGTVHEAFFDPNATGFDSQGGELEPATFTAEGTASTVEALKYENGEVVLKLDPFNALTGLHLLLIELDGSFGLVLSASSATVDATAGTLTWSVAEAPWEAGDKLMLRITSVAPP